jgi:metallophosphoesterase superfamily enzyme
MEKIKSIKVYTNDEDKVLVADSILEIQEVLENNGYIVKVQYEKEIKND